MTEELKFSAKHVQLDVLFDTVSIKITCTDDYEAQVLFDDMADRLRRGQAISFSPVQAKDLPQ